MLTKVDIKRSRFYFYSRKLVGYKGIFQFDLITFREILVDENDFLYINEGYAVECKFTCTNGITRAGIYVSWILYKLLLFYLPSIRSELSPSPKKPVETLQSIFWLAKDLDNGLANSVITFARIHVSTSFRCFLYALPGRGKKRIGLRQYSCKFKKCRDSSYLLKQNGI